MALRCDELGLIKFIGLQKIYPPLKSFRAILSETVPLLEYDLNYGSLHLIEADTGLREIEMRNCPYRCWKCNDGGHDIAQKKILRGKSEGGYDKTKDQ